MQGRTQIFFFSPCRDSDTFYKDSSHLFSKDLPPQETREAAGEVDVSTCQLQSDVPFRNLEVEDATTIMDTLSFYVPSLT